MPQDPSAFYSMLGTVSVGTLVAIAVAMGPVLRDSPRRKVSGWVAIVGVFAGFLGPLWGIGHSLQQLGGSGWLVAGGLLGPTGLALIAIFGPRPSSRVSPPADTVEAPRGATSGLGALLTLLLLARCTRGRQRLSTGVKR